MTIIMTIERYDLEQQIIDLQTSFLMSHNLQSQEHLTSGSQLTQDLKTQEKEVKEVELVDDLRKDETETVETKKYDLLTQSINGASSYSTKARTL